MFIARHGVHRHWQEVFTSADLTLSRLVSSSSRNENPELQSEHTV